MKIAAIDLGSNTFHLIIAERSSETTNIIYKTNKPVKLSEDITTNNSIIPAAFERGIVCLQEFKTIIDHQKVSKVRAVATSAIRSALNGEDFIQQVKRLTGITIEIISGEQEASLIYEGVKASGVINGKTLIMDIGGGSTEFIFCDQNKAHWKKSYNIGAARLMQRHFHSDPLHPAELKDLINYLDNTLKDLIAYNENFRATNLVGSAGAFESYSDMLATDSGIQEIRSSKLDLQKYRDLSTKLLISSHEERLHIPNLIPLRVDMIVMASVLIDYILDNLNIQNMYMSRYDLKYGILNTFLT